MDDYSLWEIPLPPRKKNYGVGYSSTHLSSEDIHSLPYKLWKEMIAKCYSASDSVREKHNGHFVQCYNKWLDYRNFEKWFNNNCKFDYKQLQSVVITITRCIISADNLMYNPNNCAVVPSKIDMCLKRGNHDIEHRRNLAEEYRDYITDDVYEIMTEDLYGQDEDY